MKQLLCPRALLPLVLLAVLLALVPLVGDVHKIMALILAFRPGALLLFVVLMGVYEAIRGVQWHVMLRALGIQVPLRAQIFSFLGGEVTKSLPIGNYFQNYLLQQAKGTDFGLSSAATTLAIWVEVAVSLVGVAILGISGWDWLQPLIMGGTPVFMLLAWLLYTSLSTHTAPRWMREHRTTVALLAGLAHFRGGAAALVHPRILAPVVALGALYLVVAALGLYVIAQGLGIEGMTVRDALVVYLFSLAIGLIIPIPVDIGLTEGSGIGALLAVGVSRNGAVSLMLLNRVLSTLAAIVIALVAALFLGEEFRAVLRARPRRRPESGGVDRSHVA